MALIKCPECKNSISNKAEKCPHCGVPASYFADLGQELEVAPASQLDYKNLGNILDELLETVLDDPECNTREKLSEIAVNIAKQNGIL